MSTKTKTPAAPNGIDIDQTYEVVSLTGNTDPLKEHPQNPRRGVVEAIDQSIEKNGWYGAIIAQKSTGYILAGNHRYRAAVEKGATDIPVIWRDVDDETALRILLADNRTADLGTYDEELLDGLLQELGDLTGTGYSFVMDAVQEQDEAPEPEPAAPAADEVPDDVYTPTYGVMVVLHTEEAQQACYEWFAERQTEGLGDWADGATLRVVAV